jgi:hypothetical protein
MHPEVLDDEVGYACFRLPFAASMLWSLSHYSGLVAVLAHSLCWFAGLLVCCSLQVTKKAQRGIPGPSDLGITVS